MSGNLVKKAYDKVADMYASKRNQVSSITYLEKFCKFVEKGKTVLDIGCGAGKPIDEFLVKKGFAVNGIDISPKMIELAKKNVSGAFYEVKDMTELQDREYCVDGIVSFYAIFHTPRVMHQTLLMRFASFMPKGGALLITMGANGEDSGSIEDFHGEKLFYSFYPPEKNRELVEKAGFSILLDEIDTSGNERHQVILATLA